MEKPESKIQEMLEGMNPCQRIPYTDEVLSELINLFLEHRDMYLEAQKEIFRLALNGNLSPLSVFQSKVDKILALMPPEEGDHDDQRHPETE